MNKTQDYQGYYLDGLNEQQLEAVLCPADIVFVSSGPGTGKTMLLTNKLVHTIQDTALPQSIVALSYTNSAARQLGDRLQSRLTECGINKRFQLFSGTIHSFCYRMLRRYYSDLQLTILDDEELGELAEDIRERYSRFPASKILQCLKADSSPSLELYDIVTSIKDSLKVISIQDILVLFINALEEDVPFRLWIKNQMTVIAVDEAQDLSELNYMILDILLEIIPGLKVFLVGDPRQNIFEFNGGSYKHLEGFLSRHPNHEIKALTLSYRCCTAVVDYVNTFRFTDCPNYQLQAIDARWGMVTVLECQTEADEAYRVLQETRKRSSLRQCSVICNNLKYLSTLVNLLIRENVPYKVSGGRKTIKKHIRFLNHVLRIIDTENAYSIRKVAQYAEIDIVRDGKKRKSAFFESSFGQTILEIRDSVALSLREIVERVISDILSGPEDDEEIAEDYSAIKSLANQFSSIQDYMAAFATDKELFAQFYVADYEECPFPVGDDYLNLSTIHSAKGLEWDTVFILGLCEGQFPNEYFCQNLPPEEQQEFFNNEWRKMYVASTRAKDHLFLCYPHSLTRKGFSFNKECSRFISNLKTN